MNRAQKRQGFFIPEYGIAALILTVLFNTLVYNGSRLIAGNWRHFNIEGAIDRLIPFWPPAIIVYFGCYLFWAVNYILIARQNKREVCQFFSGELLAKLVCLICFLAFPTTNTRPAVPASGLWNRAMIFLYSIDAADNLFPSIHCLVSWFCYIGLRGKPAVPAWYRGFSCLLAILVCISTLLTKQHVVWDVIGGVILAELCFYIGKKTTLWKLYEGLLNRLGRWAVQIRGRN